MINKNNFDFLLLQNVLNVLNITISESQEDELVILIEYYKNKFNSSYFQYQGDEKVYSMIKNSLLKGYDFNESIENAYKIIDTNFLINLRKSQCGSSNYVWDWTYGFGVI